MEVTIGGDRLGSGQKMKTNLHTYNRSTHNLSKNFLSTIAPGVLYPFYCNVGLNGDSFEMDLKAAVRTLPTQGPLFGSFKLQADVFVCPIRLYQGILHNNPINIGLQMQNVKLPQITLKAKEQSVEDIVCRGHKLNEQINKSALLNYLGIRGLGLKTETETGYDIKRNFNAVGVLSYYDICKNYYCNKQEQKAYVITPNVMIYSRLEINEVYLDGQHLGRVVNITPQMWGEDKQLQITQTNLADEKADEISSENLEFIVIGSTSDWGGQPHTIVKMWVDEAIEKGYLEFYGKYRTDNRLSITYLLKKLPEYVDTNGVPAEIDMIKIEEQANVIRKGIGLRGFTLSNIDAMRMQILSENELGTTFEINEERCGADPSGVDEGFYPYKTLVNTHGNGIENIYNNTYAMNGLMVKTYQSDIFNNWLEAESIIGENGVNEITRIDTSEGLTMDILNITQKIYNVLNRIVTAGGTYQDWQDAVYTDNVRRMTETPMWVGGYSDEVVFEEVVQTSQTEETPLGQLGGKGRTLGKTKGGKITFKVEEPSFIIGIVSITPRICYSQGNKWFNTDIESIDDLHKPALDGIGFQELITEQMAWFDASINEIDELRRNSAGFTPAWINYMTDVDEVYGEFAEKDKKGFMVLDRDYEPNTGVRTGLFVMDTVIKDLTTYIDPTKYNYAFAEADLEAQNFWLEIENKITARRLMSAKIIPNL